MSLGRTTGKYSHSEKQVKALNSGDDFPSITELPLYIHFHFPLSPILSQDLPFSNTTGVL
jgi:hypothetical protein